jgi:hypothetical protein
MVGVVMGVVWPWGAVWGQVEGTEFRGEASTGGSGKVWRFKVTKVAASELGAEAAVVGEVKLLKGDGETSYAGYSGTINLPATVDQWGNTYRVTSCENPLFEGSGVTGVLVGGDWFNYPYTPYLASLDASPDGKGFGSGVKIVDISYAPLPSIYLHQDYLGSNLTSLTVSQGSNAIPDYAFSGCTSLTNFSPVHNEGIPAIGKGAFAGCPINRVDLGGGSVGNFAFSHLKSVHFSAAYWPSTSLILRPEIPGTDPNSPEQLGAINNSLTTVTAMPDYTVYVPAAYFYNFTALTTFNWAHRSTANEPLKIVGDSAFLNTQVGASFTSAGSLTTIGVRAFADAGINTRSPNAPLKLQGTLRSIGVGAFANNPNLTRVDLSVLDFAAMGLNTSNYEAVVAGWFAGCPLESITYPSHIPSSNGFVFSAKAETGGSGKVWRFEVSKSADPPAEGEVGVLKGDAETSYKGFSGTIDLPQTVIYQGVRYRVTSCENPLFEGSGVTGVNVGGVITQLAYSLSDGSGFGSGVKSVNVAYAALGSQYLSKTYLGTKLTTLNIGNNNAIPAYAFKDVSSLRNLTLEWNAYFPDMGQGAFAGCPLENVEIPTYQNYSGYGNFSLSHAKRISISTTRWPSSLIFRPELSGVDPESYAQRTAENTSLTSFLAFAAWTSNVPARFFYNFRALTNINWSSVVIVNDSAFMNTNVGAPFTSDYVLRTIGTRGFYNAGINTRSPNPPLKLQSSLDSIAPLAFGGNPDLTRLDITELKSENLDSFATASGWFAHTYWGESGGWFSNSTVEQLIVGKQVIDTGAFTSFNALKAVAVLTPDLSVLNPEAFPAGSDTGAVKTLYLDYDLVSTYEGFPHYARKPAFLGSTPGSKGAVSSYTFRAGLEGKLEIPLVLWADYLGEEVDASGVVPVEVVLPSILGESYANAFDVEVGNPVVLTPKAGVNMFLWGGSRPNPITIKLPPSEKSFGLTPAPFTVNMNVLTPWVTEIGFAEPEVAPAELAAGRWATVRATVVVDGIEIVKAEPGTMQMVWSTSTPELVELSSVWDWNMVSIRLKEAAQIGDVIKVTGMVPPEGGGHLLTWTYTVTDAPAAVGEVFEVEGLRYKILTLPVVGSGTVTVTNELVTVPRAHSVDGYPELTRLEISSEVSYYTQRFKVVSFSAGAFHGATQLVKVKVPMSRAADVPTGAAGAFSAATGDVVKTVYVSNDMLGIAWASGWTKAAAYGVVTPGGAVDTSMTYTYGVEPHVEIPFGVWDNYLGAAVEGSSSLTGTAALPTSLSGSFAVVTGNPLVLEPKYLIALEAVSGSFEVGVPAGAVTGGLIPSPVQVQVSAAAANVFEVGGIRYKILALPNEDGIAGTVVVTSDGVTLPAPSSVDGYAGLLRWTVPSMVSYRYAHKGAVTPLPFRVASFEAGSLHGAVNLQRVKLSMTSAADVPVGAAAAFAPATGSAVKTVYMTKELLTTLEMTVGKWAQGWTKAASYVVTTASTDLTYRYGGYPLVAIPLGLYDNYAGLSVTHSLRPMVMVSESLKASVDVEVSAGEPVWLRPQGTVSLEAVSGEVAIDYSRNVVTGHHTPMGVVVKLTIPAANVFSTGGLRYKILTLPEGGEPGTVAVTSELATLPVPTEVNGYGSLTRIVVPREVWYGEQRFKVTAFEAGALVGATNLTRVKLQATSAGEVPTGAAAAFAAATGGVVKTVYVTKELTGTAWASGWSTEAAYGVGAPKAAYTYTYGVDAKVSIPVVLRDNYLGEDLVTAGLVPEVRMDAALAETFEVGAGNPVVLVPKGKVGLTAVNGSVEIGLAGNSETWGMTAAGVRVSVTVAAANVFGAGSLRYKILTVAKEGVAGTVAVTAEPVTLPAPSAVDGYGALTRVEVPVEVAYEGGVYTVKAFEAGALVGAAKLVSVKLLATSVAGVPVGAAGAFAGGAGKTVYVTKELTGIGWANGWAVVSAYAVETPETEVTYAYGVEGSLHLPYVLRDRYLGVEVVGAQAPVASLSSSLGGLFDIAQGNPVVLAPKGTVSLTAVSGSVELVAGASAATSGLTPAGVRVAVTVPASNLFSVGGLRYKITGLATEGSAGTVAVTEGNYGELVRVEVPVEVRYGGNTYRVATFEAGALVGATKLVSVKLLATTSSGVPVGAGGAFAGGAGKTVYVSKELTGIGWANGWAVVSAYAVETPGGAVDTAVRFRYGADVSVRLPYVLRDRYLGITVPYAQEPVATLSSSLGGLFDIAGGTGVVVTPKGGVAPRAVSGSVSIGVGASTGTVGLTPSELSVAVTVQVPSITGVAPEDAAAASSLANGKPLAMKATVEAAGGAIETWASGAQVEWTSTPAGLVTITEGGAWNRVLVQLTGGAKIGDAISIQATLPSSVGGSSGSWTYTIPAPPAAVGEVFGANMLSTGNSANDQLRFRITSLPEGDKSGTISLTADPVSIPRPSTYDNYPNLTEIKIIESFVQYIPRINGTKVYTGLYFDVDSIEPNTFANVPNLRIIKLESLNALAGSAAAFLPATADNPKYVYVDYPLTSIPWAEGWTVKPMLSVLTPEGKSETTFTFHHGIHDQLSLPYIIRDNYYADHYPGTSIGSDYLSRPMHLLTPTRAHEPALTEVFTLSHPNHVTLHFTPLSSTDHESDLKISFLPIDDNFMCGLTPAPLTVHVKAYTPVIDTVFGSITTDKSLGQLRLGEAVTLTANDPYESVEGKRIDRPFALSTPLRWIYDGARFTGSVPVVNYIQEPYSLTVTPKASTGLNFNVPLSFKTSYAKSPELKLAAVAVSLNLSYDATILPATARIRASVLADGVAIAPRANFLTWHQDEALNLSLAATAPGVPGGALPEPVLKLADEGTFTTCLTSVHAGYGRVHYSLPAEWGGVQSPELAFYLPEDLLGVYPPALIEGTIVLYEVGHPETPLDLATPLELREGETRYLYARIATDFSDGQGHTLLTPFLKWNASPDYLIECTPRSDGSVALTARLGSSSFGATPTLTVGIDPAEIANNPAIAFPEDLNTTLSLPAPAALAFSILPAAPAPAPVPPVEPEPAPAPVPPVEPEAPEAPEEPEVPALPADEPVEPEAPELPEDEPVEPEPPVEEGEPEGEPVVEAVDSPPLKVVSVGGVEGRYIIYTLSGRVVSAPLQPGLYILKGGDSVRKVLVK